MPIRLHPLVWLIACAYSLSVRTAVALADDPPSSQPAKKPRPYVEEKVTVTTGKYKLPGILTLPLAANPIKIPAVVLVHGSGPHDADETIGPNKVFRDIARGLARRGIGVLRYEKRTKKYALQMIAEEVNLDREVVKDALSAVKVCRAHERINPDRVYVLGHSLGGTMAPVIADRDKHLAGIIILSGTPRSLLDLVDEQMDYLMKESGKTTGKQQRMLEEIHRTTQLIRDGKYEEIKAPLLGAPTPYWAELHKLDVLSPARRFDQPILIIGGGRDYQVTKKCFVAWKSGLNGKSNVTYKWYDELNHLMMPGSDPPSPNDYFNKDHVSKTVLSDIAAWIQMKS